MMRRDLEVRTKAFAVRVVKLIKRFLKSLDGVEVGRQLLNAGTSIGANYREANHAESKRDFVHKISIAEKEAAETEYWLEICESCALGSPEEIRNLLQESTEILSILVSIGRKAKGYGD